MASRKHSHKMKSSITDKREKSLLRVHRRSIDQREMRQQQQNKFRQLDDMSPVIESQNASKNPSNSGTPVTQKAAVSRLEMLKKWKAERELKRKLEAMEKAKSKPGFKVVHMTYKENQLYAKTQNKETGKAETSKSSSTVTTKRPVPKASVVPSVKEKTGKSSASKKPEAPTRPTKAPAAATTRTTRSRATAAKTVSPAATKTRQPSPKRTGKSNFMAPTAASRTRATTNNKKVPAPAVERKGKGKEKTVPPAQPVVKDAGKVSSHRGGSVDQLELPSFAPTDFVFEAPSNVPSFVFKPLSPASAADFLFPRGSGNSTTMSAFSFTDKTDGTSTPKRGMASTSSSKGETPPDNRSVTSSDVSQDPGRSVKNQPNSKARRSRVTPVGASPVPSGKNVGCEPAMDSGIEINTMEIDSGNLRSQNPSDNIGSGESEVSTTDEISSPVKHKRRSKIQQSNSDKLQAETVSVEEQPGKEEDLSACLVSKKEGKRKNKRVTILEKAATESGDLNEGVSEAKQPRRSRRSTAAKSESASEGVNGVIEEENAIINPLPLVEENQQQTPGKTRRSRRSSVAKAKQTEQPSTAPLVLIQENEVQKHKEEVPVSNILGNSEPVKAESEECSTSSGENTVQETRSPLKKRRSRRSAVKEKDQESVSSNDDTSKEDKHAKSDEKVTASEFIIPETEPSEAVTPVKHNLRSKRAKDDLFLTPGPPVSSQKRSTKRRRTAAMIALSSASSPEEAIRIICTSPMVEMNRRTPKSKISPELRKNSVASLFDDDDSALEPIQLSSVFGNSSTEGTVSTTDDTTDDGAVSDGASTVDNTSVGTSSTTGKAESCGSEPENEKRDVTPFRERLSAEIKRLTDLSDHWTSVRQSTSQLAEEVEGQIRTTVCQAQLLMDKKGKFHQFAGLVDKCESGDPSTTCQDLQGFWDMIFIQAEDIYSKFTKLEQLQQNNWQLETGAETAKPAKKVKKMAVGGMKKTEKPAVKSKFAAFKAQMMKQRKAQEEGSSDVAEEKVFDAGFFKVNSPVKSPQYHCEAGTPLKSKSSPGSKQPGTTPSAPKAMSTENQSPVATKATPKSPMEDKENVAKVLLRRSIGATPGRRSFVPSVPSPLLQDGVPPPSYTSPAKSPTKGEDNTTTAAPICGEGEADRGEGTPVRPRRRSTRTRKSVCFAEKAKESGMDDVKEEDIDFMAYFQPTSSQSTSPLKESAVENSPFSIEDILKHSKSGTPTEASPAVQQSSGQRQTGCLKSLPSRERRKSRRSVSFAACSSSSGVGMTLPSTPYNRNSLVAGKRVTRRSVASPGGSDQSLLGELQQISGTPPLRRSARPSLLYTPPKRDKNEPNTPAKDVPVAKLISFSP